VLAPRSATAGLLACAALSLAACGEKEENLDPSGNDPVLPEPQARASFVQVEAAAAKALARSAATQKAGARRAIPEASWKITCARGPKNVVTCQVSARDCAGPIVLNPVKVPAGESPQGYVPRADASGLVCATPAPKQAPQG
jgi:hypothetical protein